MKICGLCIIMQLEKKLCFGYVFHIFGIKTLDHAKSDSCSSVWYSSYRVIQLLLLGSDVFACNVDVGVSHRDVDIAGPPPVV